MCTLPSSNGSPFSFIFPVFPVFLEEQILEIKMMIEGLLKEVGLVAVAENLNGGQVEAGIGKTTLVPLPCLLAPVSSSSFLGGTHFRNQNDD